MDELTESQQAFFTLVNGIYGELGTITGIGEPEADGNTIVGRFQDENRVFQAEITPDTIAYYEVDPETGDRIQPDEGATRGGSLLIDIRDSLVEAQRASLSEVRDVLLELTREVNELIDEEEDGEEEGEED